VNKARDAFTKAALASLGYAAGWLTYDLLAWSAREWIERRAARVNEGQAVLGDQAAEEEMQT